MKDLKYYLALPYSVELLPDDGGFTATVPDLPGCMSYGESIEAAMRGLNEAKELWFEGRFEAGESIPEPTKIEEYSGKFVLRIPRSLHRSLDREARKEGVSLNQHVLHILSERHTIHSLKGQVAEALTALASNQESLRSAWHVMRPNILACETGKVPAKGTVNLQILEDIRKPPKMLRVRCTTLHNYGEMAHAHQ